ncbi:MAG: GNAT family N-acetyltransferase [Patescibacteria group bacterium]|nr:GNAT family N-acetyltransferase [Patescibacteria group bacterium]
MKWFNVNFSSFKTKDGEIIVFRPLEEGDAEAFGKFLTSLSEETKKLFGPHPLTKEEAGKMCLQTKFSNTLRMIVSNSNSEIIGYIVISYPLRESQLQRYENYDVELIQGRDLCIAPCVSDDYQGKGIGGFMLQETIKIAKNLGAKYIILWQGTQKSNKRAIDYYKKFGFRINAEFERYDHANYDLTLSLDDDIV